MFFSSWMILSVLISSLFILLKFMFLGGNSSEKMTNNEFECGEEKMVSSSMPFNFHFFFVGLVFLVFDVELFLSIPFIFVEMELFSMVSLSIFFFLILVGLYIEVVMNSFFWE